MKFLNNLISKKKSSIGLDIGAYAVKVVELFHGEKNDLKIKNVGYAKIEKPSSRESIIRAIKESTRGANAFGKELNVAVSDPSVIVRFLELPRMTQDELRNAIPFEAEKYIPFSIDEVVIDHQQLIPQIGSNMMLVLLVAVKKDVIEERLSLLSEAGQSAGILDVASFANVNGFLAKSGEGKGGIKALIDVGARAMDISIIDENILYFTRSIQLGGNDVTKALSDALSLDFESAEELKINPKDKEPLIREKLEPVLRNMIDETRLSFSYYENQSGKNIEKVYLTGGCSKITGFYDMFKENLGINVLTWDPSRLIEADPSLDSEFVASIKDQLAVAVGLALRSK